MKKLLLLSTFAFTGILSASAQYTINQSNAPTVGSFNYIGRDTLPNVYPGSNGANQTWNLTDITPQVYDTIAYISPAGTSQASNFSQANVATSSGTQVQYYKTSGSDLKYLGGSFSLNGTSLILKGNPAETTLKFPSAYQSTFHDSSVFKGTGYVGRTIQGYKIDSVRITNTNVSDTEFDGYGTVTTQTGTFYDATRENKHTMANSIVEAYIVFFGQGSWQQVQNTNTETNTYSWYNATYQFPLAEIVITTDSLGSQSTTSATIHGMAVTGISNIAAKNAQVTVFPNPAVNELNFSILNALATSIDVFNVIGEKVETIIIPSNSSIAKLNTEQYNTGLYIYKLNNKSGATIASGKFNVSK